MNISELSIRRPVLATVMNIFILLFGFIGFYFLGVREYPAIDPPMITVSTTYVGANADVIESQITEPLEKAINGIPDIRSISSTSSVGRSQITVEFNLSADLETAANDVRDKVSQAMRSLPQDIDAPPVVTKADANSDFIIILAVQSPGKGLMELSDYAENVLQNRLQTIPEVSSVMIIGQKRPAMRLWIDPDKLNGFNLTFTDITAALKRENIEAPSGKLYGNQTEMTIRAMGRLTTEKDFRDLILREDAGGIVRLSDVAKVELGPENYEQSWRLNGVSAVGIAVIPQPGANYINISNEFNKRLDEIKNSEQGKDMIFTMLVDNTKNVRRSLNEVTETLLIAILLVIAVIFLFFRSWKMAIRPLIDIPVSLVATFFIMYVAGFSINILTLLAIVLATGLVVDDGIVVTENIFRKFEKGMPIRKAAIEGSKEIIFAVLSTSVTLAIVFLPVVFLQGFVGSLFREFGIVLAAAVLVSAFVSLTITPVLNILLTGKKDKHSLFYVKTEPFFQGLESGYKNFLTRFISIRRMAIVIIIACLAIIYLVSKQLQSELAPMEDKAAMRFMITGPEGASYDYMTKSIEGLEKYLTDSVPEFDFVFFSVPGWSSTGVNGAMGRLGLVPSSERTRTQAEITADLTKKMFRFNDIRIFPVEEQTISVGMGSRASLPVQFVIQNLDFNKLKSVIPKFLDVARSNKIFQNVDVNLKFNKPEVDIIIDRVKAGELKVSTADIADVLQSAFSGRRLDYFIMNGKQYQVISQVRLKDRQTPEDVLNLYVKNSKGHSIPLSSVLEIESNANPPSLYHYNRYKSATMSASLAEGKTVGDGVKAMQKIADSLLDESFQTSLTGPSRDYAESSSNIMFAFILALVLIYLILAAQFESFRDPFTIMLTVPLALAGAYLSLWIFGQTLNIFSQIGMIMLIGLVTKNGILIVEFANQKRKSGLSKHDAVIEASAQRLRPILMTTLATSLGALPIALSLGAAATSRIPLGIVVVGGLLFSLVLTLFVIPAMYIFISGKTKTTDE
ncbi:MAG: acriflavin resistance protein [Bacteroidetes bacterium GWF2_38_335]|nr:MAG: acriflavin resistance protein [Bacteroidetes bacterium GWF2_38_335]OFY78794.1 MAG: acriflavin resistance protein [Bacteroidetes bacterium RIFOXYA12_FULL_38_20]HBS85190.1 acriflavin resistance protein [Bacteroidales bacterium]